MKVNRPDHKGFETCGLFQKNKKINKDNLPLDVKDSVHIGNSALQEETDFLKGKRNFQKPEDISGEGNNSNNSSGEKIPLKITLDLDGKTVQKSIMGSFNDGEVALNIKHTNDVHGNMPSVANLIQPDEFWVDAGDTWQNYTFHSLIEGGRESVELMNRRDCDIAVPGNHFYDDGGKQKGDMLIKRAHFPYLSSNIGGMKAYTIAEVEGIKVAFVGVRTERKRYGLVDPSLVKDLEMKDPIESVRKAVEEVKAKGVKNIVVISHLGLEPTHDKPNIISDRELAEKVPGIDLIIGGHTHTPTHKEVVVNGTRIVHAGMEEHDANLSSIYVGDLSLKFDKSSGKIISIDHKLLPVDKSKNPNKDIEEIHNKYVNEADKIYNEKLGLSSGRFEHDVKTPADSTLGNLITDAMRKNTGADVAFLDSNFFTKWGKYEGVKYLPPGEIRMKELAGTSPWMGSSMDTSVETWDTEGRNIKKLLEEGVNKLLGPKDVEGLYQVSGLEMEYNPAKPEGERVKILSLGNKPFDPEKKYKITTTYYQGNWNAIFQGRNEEDVKDGEKLREIVASYIKDEKVIKPLQEGRIRVSSI